MGAIVAMAAHITDINGLEEKNERDDPFSSGKGPTNKKIHWSKRGYCYSLAGTRKEMDIGKAAEDGVGVMVSREILCSEVMAAPSQGCNVPC